MSTEIDGVNGIIKNTTSDGDITIKGNDGGSEITAMTIDMSAGGKVGIGTTSPSTKLTINEGGEPPAEGMLLLQANSSTRQLRIQPPTNSDNGFIDYRGGNLVFMDDGTEVMRLQGTTGVGIGESSPDTRLHVTETIDVAYSADNFTIDGNALLKLENPSTTGAAFSAIAFRTGSGADLFFGGVQGSGNEGAFKFARQGSPDQELLEIAHNGATTITTADNTDTLTLTSTDTDASVGPNLRLYRNSSSPADSDDIGAIKFDMRNDNSQDFTAFQITGDCSDVSDGTEDAEVHFDIMTAGTLREYMRMASGSAPHVTFNEGSQDIDFRVESNGNANMLFVDGGTDNVMIGTSVNIDRWFNSAPGHSTIFQTSGFSDANRVNAFTHHSNDSGGALVMLGKSRGGAVGYTAVAESDVIGTISFQGADGTDMVEAAKIEVTVDAAPGANDMPGRMTFHTTADGASGPTERMRIDNSGRMQLNMSTFGSSVSASVTGFEIHKNGSSPFIQHGTTGTGATTRYNFFNGNGVVGSISTSGSATTYATSSDYRLKENVVTDWDATTRLKQLKPSRFNFIADADTTVDGFLAHEVSSIVPEAIFGDKDKTETKTNVVVHANGHVIADGITEANWTAGKVADEDGNTQYPTDSTWAASKVVPVYQAIDQSKLVPLLVKTIQELEARITTLEG